MARGWHRRAACRDVPEDEAHLFDPRGLDEEMRDAWLRARQAMDEYCSRCVVVEECRADGVRQQGVWGGELRDYRSEHRATLGRDANPRRRGGQQLRPGTFGAMSATWNKEFGKWRARVRYRDRDGVRHDVTALGDSEQEARDRLTAALERRFAAMRPPIDEEASG